MLLNYQESYKEMMTNMKKFACLEEISEKQWVELEKYKITLEMKNGKLLTSKTSEQLPKDLKY